MNRKGGRGVKKASLPKGVAVEQTEIRIAPIPSPEDLLKYGEINPDFPDRIVRMAEQERIDRNKREDRKVEVFENVDKRHFKLKALSLSVSLIVILCFLGIAFLFLESGHERIAGSIIGLP